MCEHKKIYDVNISNFHFWCAVRCRYSQQLQHYYYEILVLHGNSVYRMYYIEIVSCVFQQTFFTRIHNTFFTHNQTNGNLYCMHIQHIDKSNELPILIRTTRCVFFDLFLTYTHTLNYNPRCISI